MYSTIFLNLHTLTNIRLVILKLHKGLLETVEDISQKEDPDIVPRNIKPLIGNIEHRQRSLIN